LTQDAIPADSCWLECLLKPFGEFSNVAGVFSRQIPRVEASLLEASDLHKAFPSERLVKTMISTSMPDRKNLWNMIRFSNSSASYDRELLLRYPFSETLEMAEDQEWAWRMLKLQFTVVYEPDSVVVHSHEHGVNEEYERSLVLGRSFSAFLSSLLGPRSILLEFGAWLVHILIDLRYSWSCSAPLKAKLKYCGLSPVRRAVTHYAYRKGWNSALAPSELADSKRTKKLVG